MMYIAVLFCLAGCALAAPADTDVVPLEKQQPTVIPIVSQSDELEPNGTHRFSYETGNGIKREETSYDKVVPKVRGRTADSNEGGESGDGDSDEIHVQQGSYSYTAPDGTVISVRYIADENGFQPIGDHIPRVPAPSSRSSAEKSSRALKAQDSAAASSAPAGSSKPADQPKDKAEAKESTPKKLDLRTEAKEPASIPSSNASAKSPESSTTEAAKALEGVVSTESSSPDISTTESAKSSETPAPTEASTTEAAKSSEVTEASSTVAPESSTPEISTTTAASTPSTV